MDVPGIPRPVLVALIAVAVLLFAAGATWAVGLVTRDTQTHTRVLAGARTIEIEDGSGDIQVVGDDRSDVRLITKERRSILGRPHVDVRYAAGRLRLDHHCSGADLFGEGCNVSYRVEVPRGAAVHLVTRSGEVHAIGVAGALRAHASSGDVHVDAPSRDIDAGAQSGDVHVDAADAVRVRAEANSGDVHIAVPDRTYAVHTSTSSGDEHVDVHVDPRAPRRIDASTGSGDVHIEPDR